MIAALLAAGCATKPPLKPDPEVAEMTRKVGTVAVLPPQVEFVEIVFSGDNQRIPEEETRIAGTLEAKLDELVGAKHFVIRKPAADADEQQKRDAAFEIEQLHAAFTAATKEEKTSDKPGFRPRASVGLAATVVASRMDADAILLSRYSGFKKSGGQAAKEIMAGALLAVLTGYAAIPAHEGGTVAMALIDGATGEILWTGGGNVGPNGSLYAIAGSLFDTFPAHEAALAATPTPAPAESGGAPQNGAPAALVPTSQSTR